MRCLRRGGQRGDIGGGAKGDGPDFRVHPLEQHRLPEGEWFVGAAPFYRFSVPQPPRHPKDPKACDNLEDESEGRLRGKQCADAKARDARNHANAKGDTKDVGYRCAKAKATTRCREEDDVRTRREEAEEDKTEERPISQEGRPSSA